jgi:hypothetical protein
MFAAESYAAVRSFVFVESHSRRQAAIVFRLNRETVARMCSFSLPPGYTRTKPVAKPKLGALIPVIDAILEADKAAPIKRRQAHRLTSTPRRGPHSDNLRREIRQMF